MINIVFYTNFHISKQELYQVESILWGQIQLSGLNHHHCSKQFHIKKSRIKVEKTQNLEIFFEFF